MGFNRVRFLLRQRAGVSSGIRTHIYLHHKQVHYLSAIDTVEIYGTAPYSQPCKGQRRTFGTPLYTREQIAVECFVFDPNSNEVTLMLHFWYNGDGITF